jgi:hypothetical protein
MVLNLDLEIISLYIDNIVFISNFYTVNYIKSIGFPFFILYKVVFVYYSWGDKVSLYSTINKYIVLVGSELYLNF